MQKFEEVMALICIFLQIINNCRRSMIGCVFNGKTRISARLCLKLSCMHLIIYEINAECWKKKPGKHFLHSTHLQDAG
jgi:hypothetical protein